jgi:uncharacterized membrane-anchored protein YhcB (DUF1043 family)
MSGELESAIRASQTGWTIFCILTFVLGVAVGMIVFRWALGHPNSLVGKHLLEET